MIPHFPRSRPTRVGAVAPSRVGAPFRWRPRCSRAERARSFVEQDRIGAPGHLRERRPASCGDFESCAPTSDRTSAPSPGVWDWACCIRFANAIGRTDPASELCWHFTSCWPSCPRDSEPRACRAVGHRCPGREHTARSKMPDLSACRPPSAVAPTLQFAFATLENGSPGPSRAEHTSQIGAATGRRPRRSQG
jgi:hypothetical protein